MKFVKHITIMPLAINKHVMYYSIGETMSIIAIVLFWGHPVLSSFIASMLFDAEIVKFDLKFLGLGS